MEITCIENAAVLHAEKDMNIFRDERVIPSLKERELTYLPHCNYFELQDDIQPYMRKVVTMWMLEVCIERLKPYIFLLLYNKYSGSNTSVECRTVHSFLLFP